MIFLCINPSLFLLFISLNFTRPFSYITDHRLQQAYIRIYISYHVALPYGDHTYIIDTVLHTFQLFLQFLNSEEWWKYLASIHSLT